MQTATSEQENKGVLLFHAFLKLVISRTYMPLTRLDYGLGTAAMVAATGLSRPGTSQQTCARAST